LDQEKKAKGLAKLKRKHVAWEDIPFTGIMEFYAEDDATGAWYENPPKFKTGKLVLIESGRSMKFGTNPSHGEKLVVLGAAKSPDDLLGETEVR